VGILIGALLLLVLSYHAFRAVRWLLDDEGSDIQRDRSDRTDAATPAEVRERELVDQVVAGRIDPEHYRQAMSELAHHDAVRAETLGEPAPWRR
jgi:hypothetical protein